MARSAYVYLVQAPETLQALAAFTVKHELKSWLDGTDRKVVVMRMRDGGPRLQPWQKFQVVTPLDPHTLDPLSA